MGDRTSVTLTVRKADQKPVELLIENSGGFDDRFEGEQLSGPNLIEYTFYEVNYGLLDFENELCKQNIPYNKSWDAGDDYPAGNEYHRIDGEGESIVKEFVAETEGLVSLEDVVKAIESSNLDNFIAEKKDDFAVISWEAQEEILGE
jgi:hypothetical protein